MEFLKQHPDLLQQIALFGMAGIAVLELLLRCVFRLLYNSLIKASADPEQSRNKLMRKMREEEQVHNVDTYVEKCLLTHKVAGLQLWNTERICRFFTCLFFIFGSTTVVLGIYLDFGQAYLLSTISTMFLLGEMLIIMGIQSRIPYQKDMVYVNLKDYAETKWQKSEMEGLVRQWKEREPEHAGAEPEKPEEREREAVAASAGVRKRGMSGPVMNSREKQLVLDVLSEYMTEQPGKEPAESLL